MYYSIICDNLFSSVSRHNKSFLQEVEDEPLLDIHELNPRLYEHVNEMNDVKVSPIFMIHAQEK